MKKETEGSPQTQRGQHPKTQRDLPKIKGRKTKGIPPNPKGAAPQNPKRSPQNQRENHPKTQMDLPKIIISTEHGWGCSLGSAGAALSPRSGAAHLPPAAAARQHPSVCADAFSLLSTLWAARGGCLHARGGGAELRSAAAASLPPHPEHPAGDRPLGTGHGDRPSGPDPDPAAR